MAQAQSDHLERLLESADADLVGRLGRPPGRKFGDQLGQGQHLVADGQVAQPGGDVHGVADVVVPFEQDDVADGDAAFDGHRVRGPSRPRTSVSRVAATSGLDSTLTSMAPSPSHLAMRTARREQITREGRPEDAEDAHRPFVAFGLGQSGEAGEVDEGECSSYPHPTMIAPRTSGKRVGVTTGRLLRFPHAQTLDAVHVLVTQADHLVALGSPLEPAALR